MFPTSGAAYKFGFAQSQSGPNLVSPVKFSFFLRNAIRCLLYEIVTKALHVQSLSIPDFSGTT